MFVDDPVQQRAAHERAVACFFRAAPVLTPPAELVRDKLVVQGIVINGLPVMMNRTNFGRPPDLTLDKYYEENVIGGPGSFMIVADNFDHFGRAVRTKLVREVSGSSAASRPVPA